MVRKTPRKKRFKTIFGYMKGTVVICGDIISHIDEVWYADSD